MSIIVDHGHRAMQPTGYRTRDIEVPEGVRVVRVPEPTYDEEHVIVPCPVCFEFGAQQERERLRAVVREYESSELTWSFIHDRLLSDDEAEWPR